MKNWVLYWLGFSFLVVIICVIIIITTFINVDNNGSILETDEYLYSAFEDRYELIQKVCEKNGNWNNLYVSKKFRTKYNEIDGFFGKITFDRVEVQPYNEDEYSFAFYPHIVLTQGLRKMVYVYQYKYSDDENDPGLEDILISSELELVDENGKELDARRVFTNELKSENISDLIHSYSLESGIAVTDKFHKKYPHFLDIFIHYSPLSHNRIAFIENESDLDNNIAVFSVNSDLECKIRKYRVRLIFDNELYLDDVEVELLDTKEYRGNSENDVLKLIYKNSNTEHIKVKDKLLERYKAQGSLFDDIDKLDLNGEPQSKYIKGDEYVCKYKMKSGESIIYHRILKVDSRDYLVDIIYERLPYGDISLEEAREKYLGEKIKLKQ